MDSLKNAVRTCSTCAGTTRLRYGGENNSDGVAWFVLIPSSTLRTVACIRRAVNRVLVTHLIKGERPMGKGCRKGASFL